MQALILDGTPPSHPSATQVVQVLTGELGRLGYAHHHAVLRDLLIAPCRGEFRCWIETPGICVIRDEGRTVVRQFIHSDLVVFLTPVTFGGYSSLLKEAVDRLIPTVSPFFARIQGETHHARRYRRYPRLLAVGLLPGPDAESQALFQHLVARNALNLHAPGHAAAFVHADSPAEAHRSPLLDGLGKAGIRVA